MTDAKGDAKAQMAPDAAAPPPAAPAVDVATAKVAFTGARAELAGIVLRGYAVMLPTLGLFRFWQATWKRRFYWQNTVIDGEPLEYTGHASQLLLGFLFALAVFVPVYMALFYLSMQDSDHLVIGYAGLGVLLWFFRGYGVYRARDFRLSRTLWRGIRFNLHGSAWAYALRRFGWSLLMLPTLGLVYPWMASSLWRYRWHHTWYGDRRFALGGNWRSFALPYYLTYFANVMVFGAAFVFVAGRKDFVPFDRFVVPGPTSLLTGAGCILFCIASLAWYRARISSRLLSTLTLGDTSLRVRVPALPLVWQYVGYALALVVAVVVLAAGALLALGGIIGAAGIHAGLQGGDVLAQAFQSGTLNVVLLIAAYLLVLGVFGLLWEIIIGYGWWRLLARATTIANPAAIATVKAAGEDTSLLGQGLADALNVGAY